MLFLRMLLNGLKDVVKYRKTMARNLRSPENTVYGWLAMRQMRNKNKYLEENAVLLSNIEPDHRVLEIGFGPGLGIQAAYNNGNGKVYGIDSSHYVIRKAEKKYEKEITMGRVELVHAPVNLLPYHSSKFDRIFHVNAYYYWENLPSSLRELYRVIKPGGKMVTTLCLDDLKRKKSKKLITRYDPLDYMLNLEHVGFKEVKIEYLKFNKITYQVIYSEASAKKIE